MTARQGALNRIGSGSSVSWFAFWVTFALNGIHHLSGSPGLTGHGAARGIAVVLSQLAMFAVLLAARATVLPDADVHPRPAATICVFAVAGAMKSLVLMAILTQVMVVPRFLIVGSLITGTFTFAAYLALCSYLVSVFAENRCRVTEAAQTQASLVAARVKADQDLRDQRHDAAEVVQADLMKAFDELTATSDAMSAAQMRSFLEETVRPSSHRLAAGIDRWQPPMTQAVDPRLRWDRLFDAVGVSPPFSPVVQACLCATPAFSTIIAIGPGHFFALLAAAVLAPFAILTLGNRLLRRLSPATSPMVRVVSVLAWVLVSALFVAVAWGVVLIGTGLAPAGFIYGIFVTVTLSLASVAATTALTAQRELHRELEVAQAELRWDLARVHQLQWHHQRLSARVLHGPVQTAVIQQTAHLGTTTRSSDSVRERLITAVRSGFEDADSMPDLRTVLDSLTRSWESLCYVTCQLACDPSAIDADPSAKACLVDVLSDSVANAVRHGYAGQVSIRVEQVSAKVLSVTVSDDGLGRSDTSGSGLGSQIMDDCCLSWERDSRANGTTVRFLMPLAGSPQTVT